MKFRIYHSSLLFFLVLHSIAQADIGNVHVALKYNLQKCLTISNSVQQNFAHLLQCIKSSLYRCLLFHKPLMKNVNTNINRVCGVINSGQLLRHYEWKITVHPKLYLSINFTHFHLPVSKLCEQTFLSLRVPVSTLDFFPRLYGLKYCGH